MSTRIIIGNLDWFIRDGISTEFLNKYFKNTGKNISLDDIRKNRDLYRSDPLIIKCCWFWAIDNFYKKGACAPVSIVEIPDGYNCVYALDYYDFGDESEYLTLFLDEEYFRNLLKQGTEDEIVDYVKQIGMRYDTTDDLICQYI